MDSRLLLGLWRAMVPLPRQIWQRQVRGEADLEFMSEDHHRVRDFVVRELPRVGAPLRPEMLARELALPLPRTVEILEELEQHMTFLFRNEQGEVVWAYPVTAAKTPHRVTFDSGERIYAA